MNKWKNGMIKNEKIFQYFWETLSQNLSYILPDALKDDRQSSFKDKITDLEIKAT